MFFFAGMSGIYLVLVLWYYLGMKMFQDAAIPIQKYILTTLVLGFFEASFQAINLYIWNVTGTQSPFVVYTGKPLISALLRLDGLKKTYERDSHTPLAFVTTNYTAL